MDLSTFTYRWARQNKAKFIGSGLYARVYKIGDKAYKIFKFGEGYDTIDYLLYCKRRHHKNPWLPKVYGMWLSEGFVITEMELLSKKSTRQREDAFARLCGTEEITDKHLARHAINKSTCDHLTSVLKYLKRKNVEWDIHRYNYLWRGDQIVIVDPCAS